MSEQDASMAETAETAATDDRGSEVEGADDLRDAGKKALDSMKSKWTAERDRRKAIEQELATLRAAAPEGEKVDAEGVDAEKIREQARAEARAEGLRERALDKIEARAAKTFADPEDARALLASAVEDFIDGGKVDVEAITAALDDLLNRKPHLAAATARRFQGGVDGGARNGSKPMLSRADVQQLAREGRHADINKAREEGRIDYARK